MTKELSRPSWFGQVVGQIGNYLIPDHVKRIMFIVTVYHYMIGDLNNDKLDDLEELSEAMNLAKTSSSALILPGFFTGKIWSSKSVERLLKITPDKNSSRVFQLIPCWLHYGRANDIANDVVKLRDYVATHKAA